MRALYNHVLAAITSYRNNTTPGHVHPHPSLLPLLQPHNSTATANTPTTTATTPHHPSTDDDISNNETSNQNHHATPASSTSATHRERLGGYLHPRDMRRLVTPFSSTNVPVFMVRRHVLLLILDPLRAIVLRDRLLLLVPDGADEILNHLESRLRGGLQDLEDDVFGHAAEPPHYDDNNNNDIDDFILHPTTVTSSSPPPPTPKTTTKSATTSTPTQPTTPPTLVLEKESSPSTTEISPTTTDNHNHEYTKSSSFHPMHDEWQDINQRTFTKLPFELLAVDVVLESVVRLLASETKQLCDSVEATMKHILTVMEGGKVATSSPPRTMDDKKNKKNNYEKLHILKDQAKETQSRIKGLERALTLVLDDDADLALMNLSRLITHPERFVFPLSQSILNQEADEPELILEAYLEQAFNTSNTLELLLGKINTTEGLVDVKLDTIRNRLLFVNTFFSLVMLFLGAGGLVGSLFGMNLLNYLEDDPTAFNKVVIGTVVGGFVLFCLSCFIFWRHSTWLLHS